MKKNIYYNKHDKTCSPQNLCCLTRTLICMTMCLCIITHIIPQMAYADSFSLYIGGQLVFTTEYSTTDSGESKHSNSRSKDYNSSLEKIYQYETASDIDKVIEICKKYNDKSSVVGVRNQIDWMNQLYVSAVQGFNSKLGLGDALLIALLNHTDINTTLITSSYSMGDITREVARQIVAGADGYVDIDTISDAIGLKAKDVRSILERIAAGTITEKTIAVGKNRTRASTRGVYVNNQALKQDKIYKYLTAEVERMTTNSDSLNTLYNDLGAGYVNNMLAGYEVDKYQVMLYKEHLAKTLDNTLETVDLESLATNISGTDAYKVTKKTRSALSKVYKYMINAEEEALPDELRSFLKEHLENGILSESEAKEFLILSGEYEEGEYGIGEAAKQIAKGYKHLQNFESALDVSGKVIDTADKIKKAEELIEYWATDYAQQEMLLEHMVEVLSNSGADIELMVAAQELQNEYSDKLSGTFDKVYTELIDKGIGTVKAAFPPLGIAESCISLAGTLTGADNHVDAIETGLAMQGICKQAIEDYEKAVIAVSNGDTSEEAVNRVLTNFEIARQSLVSYYKSMVELAETEEEKSMYASELNKLENMQFGYAVVEFPLGGGGGGSR